jgi:hypothetical protein
MSTVELLSTDFSARVGQVHAVDDVSVLAAVAAGHFFLFARLAASWVAVAFAAVFPAVEELLALLAALEHQPFLAALGHAWTFTALAGHQGAFVLAGGTLALVADAGTGVAAVRSSFLVADFSAGVGGEIAVVLGVEMLSAEAVVFWHGFVVLEVALGTFPVEDVQGLFG